MYEELVERLRSHNGWALNKTLDEAADAIEKLEKAFPRWIPVTEILPKKDGSYLCWLTYTVYLNPGPGETRVCCDVVHFDVKSKSWFLGFKYLRSPKVLAWMPLPEPPKEEEI